jgi:PIN domain nuclease of toxin-antitoxin system
LSGLLLDTHTLLWGLGDVDRLSPAAHEVLSAGATPAYVSAASIWEIGIKRASGKLRVPDDLLDRVAAASFQELAINFSHAAVVGTLPRHHGDPFDRMIVAQAKCEGLTVVTCDERIAVYDVPVLW